MSAELINNLDLDLSWSRVKRDLSKRRTFVCHPFIVDLIEQDLPSWLDHLRSKLAEGEFKPAPCKMVPVPKQSGLIRPGADIRIQDQIVYSAAVRVACPFIRETLRWEGDHPDFAYRLRDNDNHTEWFKPHYPQWKEFDARSLEVMERGRPFIAVADIAGYYEMIDLFILRSDLMSLGIDREVIQLILDCLHRWARVQKRGIPQGFSPSDLLGKLYLNAVDHSLRAEGLVHMRWVDDFRIFCRTESEARKALLILAETLGNRGLVFQSAKSEILSEDKAQARFNDVHALLDPIQKNVMEHLIDLGLAGGPSMTAYDLDKILSGMQESEPIDVLKEAYNRYFIADENSFNKTLFRYLLNRLGSAGDTFALDNALEQLGRHPEENDTIADYAKSVAAVQRFEDKYLTLRDQGLLPYDYQLYQVFRWRLRCEEKPGDPLMRMARSVAFDPIGTSYVRAVARAILGRWGEPADLERLQSAYPDAQSDEERTEIIYALSRMEKSRRNAFLGHAAGDGELPSRAVRAVRGGCVRWDAC